MPGNRWASIAVLACGLALVAPVNASATITVYSDSWPDHQDDVSGYVWMWSYGSASSDEGSGDLVINLLVTAPDGSLISSNSNSTYGTFVDTTTLWLLRDYSPEGDYQTYASADFNGQHSACVAVFINWTMGTGY